MVRSRKHSVLDRRLFPRASQCISQFEAEGSAYASVSQIAVALRTQFPEYARLPAAPFNQTVQKVVVRLLEQNEYFLKIRGLGAEEDDESDDEELLEVDESSNMMNSSLREVYGSINKIEENEIIINASEKEKEKPDEEGQKKLAANKKRKGSDLGKSSSSGAAKKSQKSVSEWNALVEKPTVTTYADVGGMEKVLQEVRELVEPALLHPEIYEHLGVSAPSGILLHGPPGCGKTLLVHAIAGELGVNFLKVAAPEIVSGMSGESEAKVRSLFEEAIQASPCLLFLDEIDAITPKRENAGKEMERRIVAQLLNSMDELGKSGASVVVIGATNRPDSLDSALRRAGRFEREVLVGIPDESARNSILRKMACKMKLEGAFNFEKIARLTPGFVGADLASLTKEAASIAIRRVYQGLAESTSRSEVSDHLKSRTERLTPEELEPLFVRMEDFEQALSVIQPSSKREGFATIPDVSWEDIGALDTLRKQLHMSVVLPIRSPELFRSVGLSSPAGALLFGPPGCGKTLVAKAIANESRASFISVKGPELLNKFVGESERAVRLVFQRARASSPCVIFFDELDALCPKRGSGGDRSENVTERVVNQLLTEMDGLEQRNQVFVIAATNRPDIIDPAMLRPGRLDRILYVPLPCPEGRLSILQTLVRKSPLDSDVNLVEIANHVKVSGFSGADLASLVREASVLAIEDAIPNIHEIHEDEKIPERNVRVSMRHFIEALHGIHPSVSESQQKRYDRMQKMLCRSRAAVQEDKESSEDVNIQDAVIQN